MNFKFFKKNFNFILLFIVFILLACMYIWRSKIIEGHDIDKLKDIPGGDYETKKMEDEDGFIIKKKMRTKKYK